MSTNSEAERLAAIDRLGQAISADKDGLVATILSEAKAAGISAAAAALTLMNAGIGSTTEKAWREGYRDSEQIRAIFHTVEAYVADRRYELKRRRARR